MFPRVVVTDFDNTVFRKNFGILEENVNKITQHGLPVIVLTHRADDQAPFIKSQLTGVLPVVAIYCTGDKTQNPNSKAFLLSEIRKRWHVVAHYDDDPRVTN